MKCKKCQHKYSVLGDDGVCGFCYLKAHKNIPVIDPASQSAPYADISIDYEMTATAASIQGSWWKHQPDAFEMKPWGEKSKAEPRDKGLEAIGRRFQRAFAKAAKGG